MAQTTVYVKAERNTEMRADDVFLKDIASLYCDDKAVLARAKAIKLHTFHKDGQSRFFYQYDGSDQTDQGDGIGR